MITSINLKTRKLTRDDVSILLPGEIVDALMKGSTREIYIVNNDVTVEDTRGRSRRAFGAEAAAIRKIVESQEPWIQQQIAIRESQQEFLAMMPALLLQVTEPGGTLNDDPHPARLKLLMMTAIINVGEQNGYFSDDDLQALKVRQLQVAQAVKDIPDTPDPYEEQ